MTGLAAMTVLAPSASVIVAVTARSVPFGSVLFVKGSDPPPTTTSAPVLPTKLNKYVSP